MNTIDLRKKQEFMGEEILIRHFEDVCIMNDEGFPDIVIMTKEQHEKLMNRYNMVREDTGEKIFHMSESFKKIKFEII